MFIMKNLLFDKWYFPRLKAVIIEERNYMGNHSSGFSYSYSFTVNSKTYTGHSHNPVLIIGDTIEIEYDKNNPVFNKPLHPKD